MQNLLSSLPQIARDAYQLGKTLLFLRAGKLATCEKLRLDKYVLRKDTCVRLVVHVLICSVCFFVGVKHPNIVINCLFKKIERGSHHYTKALEARSHSQVV